MDFTAALQGASPLLLGMSRDFLSGQRGGVGAAQQGLALMQAKQEEQAKQARAMEALRALGIGGAPSGGAPAGLSSISVAPLPAPGQGPVAPAPAGLGSLPGIQPTGGLDALGGRAPSGLGSMPQAPQLPPQIAQAAQVLAASQGPEAAVRFITDYQLKAATTSPAAGPTSVQEFEAAKAEGYQGRYVDFLRDKATWSRAPGTSVKIVNEGSIPPGYQMVRDANNNPLRLQPIPGSPAYNEALSGAESSVATADEIIRDIDAVIADPNLERATGWGSYLPVDIPGFNAETRSRLNKLEGQAFLGAIDRLKGTGQITEIEGQKATQAIARLNAAQSADEFRTALREFRSVVDAGRRRAVRNLQTTTGRAAPNVPPLTPAEMADEELMRALGLE